MNNIQKLIKVADHLDKLGLVSEANQVDWLIRKIANHHQYKNEPNTVEGLLERFSILFKSIAKAKRSLGFHPTEMSAQESEEGSEEDIEVIEGNLDYHDVYVAFNEINDSLVDHIIPSATSLLSSQTFRHYKPYTNLFRRIILTADDVYHGRIDGLPYFKEMPNYISDILYKEDIPSLSEEEVARLQAELSAATDIFNSHYDNLVTLERELTAGNKPKPVTSPISPATEDTTRPVEFEETKYI